MQKSPIISPYIYPGIRVDDLPKDIQEACIKKHCDTSQKKILKIVAHTFKVTEKEIISKSRKVVHVNARYLYYACIKLKYGLSSTIIGGHVDRDHASVLHGFKEFANRYQLEFDYRNSCKQVFDTLSINYSRSKLLSPARKNWY
jgi:chromosomal replication initiation ATPase DnaA